MPIQDYVYKKFMQRPEPTPVSNDGQLSSSRDPEQQQLSTCSACNKRFEDPIQRLVHEQYRCPVLESLGGPDSEMACCVDGCSFKGDKEAMQEHQNRHLCCKGCAAILPLISWRDDEKAKATLETVRLEHHVNCSRIPKEIYVTDDKIDTQQAFRTITDKPSYLCTYHPDCRFMFWKASKLESHIRTHDECDLGCGFSHMLVFKNATEKSQLFALHRLQLLHLINCIAASNEQVLEELNSFVNHNKDVCRISECLWEARFHSSRNGETLISHQKKHDQCRQCDHRFIFPWHLQHDTATARLAVVRNRLFSSNTSGMLVIYQTV